MDGFLFDQKISLIIADEFKRMQGKVDANIANISSFYAQMTEIEKKIEIMRAQMSRVSKFDGAVESFNRQAQVMQDSNHFLQT